MDPGVVRALKILDEVEPIPTGPVALSPEYLRAVAAVEALPENRSGADKSWVHALVQLDDDFFARASWVR
jgi:hypothetical protein